MHVRQCIDIAVNRLLSDFSADIAGCFGKSERQRREIVLFGRFWIVFDLFLTILGPNSALRQDHLESMFGSLWKYLNVGKLKSVLLH